VPIAFPPQDRGPDWDWASTLNQTEVDVDATNLAAIGQEFDGLVLDPGIGIGWNVGRAVNLRNLGSDFEGPEWQGRMNPVKTIAIDPTKWSVFFDYTFAGLSGITRDSTGAVLGGCTVEMFYTLGDVWVQGTVSDASGAFSFSQMAPGPYYFVAYLPGSPDVAGTSVNTLQPA
jgi:hypothetical protein